ncbi:MAG: hypothetical protein F4Y03_09450 [Alphaproteobacteria bacterium]|nr:hypothetical protein [Alphaproteobacteria bacterium]
MTPFEDNVLAILREAGRPMSAYEICDRHPHGHAAAIAGLALLERDGRITARRVKAQQLGPIYIPGSENYTIAETAS